MGKSERGQYSPRSEAFVPTSSGKIPNFLPREVCLPLLEEDATTINNIQEKEFAQFLLELKQVLKGVITAVYYEPGKVTSNRLNKHTVPDFLLVVKGQIYFFEVGLRTKTEINGKLVEKKKLQRRILTETGKPVGVIGPSELAELKKVAVNYPEAALALLLHLTAKDSNGSIDSMRDMVGAYLSPMA